MSGGGWQEEKDKRGTRRTLLPLIDIAGANASLKDDLAVAGLCAGDEEGLLGGVVVVAKAKSGALVDPARVDELVDLSAWARGWTFASTWRRRICEARPSSRLHATVRNKRDKRQGASANGPHTRAAMMRGKKIEKKSRGGGEGGRTLTRFKSRPSSWNHC